jgi:hypothetical protein
LDFQLGGGNCISPEYLFGVPSGCHYHGIYRLKGDRLSLCLPIDGDHPRPTELLTSRGDGHILLVFKRKK